jgi:SAM-dependent methyltransferase
VPVANDDAQPPSDEEVGGYYEDESRAETLARLYDAPTALGEFYRDRMRRIGRLLDEAAGNLLDAGCGTGQMLRFLHETAPGRFHLTGLDRSSANIAVARRVVGGDAARLVVGRIETMPFDDRSFDVVLAMGSFEYVADADQGLRELARVTRPGGIAIVTMQNALSPYRLWESKIWSPLRRRRHPGTSPIVRRWRTSRLSTALIAVGFSLESVERYGFNLFLPPLDTRLPRAAIALQRRLDRLVRGPLRRAATDYAVVARRTGVD